MPKAPQGRPVGLSERILALDVLRGFAMLGVLIAYCMWSLGTAPEASWSALDKRVDEIAAFLVDGKFYTILATLFGVGFSIQLGRASDDSAAVETYCRRLGVLSGIGLAHALLLRNGDILLPYALTGFLLIPFRRASDRVLVASALAILLATAAIRALWEQLGLPPLERPSVNNASYLVENAAWVRYWYSTALFTWPVNLTMFLFGYCLGRARILTKLAELPRMLVTIAAIGLTAGVAFHFGRQAVLDALPASNATSALAWLFYTFHCWGMSSAYAALLVLALRTRSGAVALAPLSAVGRLALTNYLSQAGIIVPLCLIFGLFDRFTPTSALALGAALFVLVQMPFSIFWARNFQFGPAEWVWRLLTYERLPPLRLRKTALAPL
jgi:uncharacterized protein